MQWKDVTNKHDGMKASLSAESTPNRVIRGEGPFVGVIRCRDGYVPVVIQGDVAHSFAEWWNVELIACKETAY